MSRMNMRAAEEIKRFYVSKLTILGRVGKFYDRINSDLARVLPPKHMLFIRFEFAFNRYYDPVRIFFICFVFKSYY